jgi:hypothetical protein
MNEVLPMEILGMIFEEHAKVEWRAPTVVGQVCRLWRRTVLTSPRAWTHLTISKKHKPTTSELRRWLDRSGTAPLHICAAVNGPIVDALLDQHHKKIEFLTVYQVSSLIAKARVFPILESLKIIAWNVSANIGAANVMPNLRHLHAGFVNVDALLSNNYPPLTSLTLYGVSNCGGLVQSSCNSLTSLMLKTVSLHDISGPLVFPCLTFLSLWDVRNLKPRIKVPALTTYHEGGRTDDESFSMPLPLLTEYGVSQHEKYPASLSDITVLHRCYPNLRRLAIYSCIQVVKSFLHSLAAQPTALPILGILAVGSTEVIYSKEDIASMMFDVSLRNTASKVRMKLHDETYGPYRVPLFFAEVRIYTK